MKYPAAVLVITVLSICLVATSGKIVRARLESCPGCSLNRLLEVRQFAYEDIKKYKDVEWKKISGAKPELVFLNDQDEEIERVPLSTLNRKECNEVLTSRGFTQEKNEEL
ncbi:selenoprotein M-like [Diorhabda sublineata]|uniref:selenoprotein M-like n=1 Tax=Diorhabda sublineata TaxID=1163346 RepID=UPI0024E05BDE|nr:selenoprotein M-like [Diorhabda sublineata]